MDNFLLVPMPLDDFKKLVRDTVREEVQRALPANGGAATAKQDRTGGVELAAEVTGLSKQRVYTLSSQGLIPCTNRTGGRLRFSEAALLKWMAEGEKTTLAKQALSRMRAAADKGRGAQNRSKQ